MLLAILANTVDQVEQSPLLPVFASFALAVVAAIIGYLIKSVFSSTKADIEKLNRVVEDVKLHGSDQAKETRGQVNFLNDSLRGLREDSERNFEKLERKIELNQQKTDNKLEEIQKWIRVRG